MILQVRARDVTGFLFSPGGIFSCRGKKRPRHDPQPGRRGKKETGTIPGGKKKPGTVPSLACGEKEKPGTILAGLAGEKKTRPGSSAGQLPQTDRAWFLIFPGRSAGIVTGFFFRDKKPPAGNSAPSLEP